MTHPNAEILFPLLIAELKDYSIFTMNLEGEVQSWNRGAQQIFGYTEEEIIGRPVSILFTDEDNAADVPAKEIRNVIETGRAEDNRWHVRKDGSRFFAAGVSVGVREGDTLVALAKVVRDATLRRITETQVAMQTAATEVLAGAATVEQAAPELLRVLCEHIGWQIGQFWLVRDQSSIDFVSNWTAPTLEGVDEEGLGSPSPMSRGVGVPGRVWASGESEWIVDVASHADLPRKGSMMQSGVVSALAFPVLFENEVLAVFEFFMRQRVPPDESVMQALGIIGKQLGLFIRRRIAEEELRRSEEQYRNLTETASDAIISIDDNSTVVSANPAIERLLGFTPADLVGKSMNLIVPERFRKSHEKGMRHYLETGDRRINWNAFELQALHKDGREVPIEISFGELTRGGRHFFTAVLRDITARKEVDTERLRLITDAQEANRVKDEFLAMVSHELRTPMTAVLGWIRLLKMGADEETMREAIDAIERSASAQAQLIDDMLDVSRIAAGKLRFRIEPTSLPEVIDTAIDTVRIAAQARGIEIRTAIDHSVPLVAGDRSRLQQVVWNLLTNAVKFTRTGGQIDVRLKRADGSALITVSDSGEGISADFLPFVFDRFRQAETSSRRPHGGLGLGLAIVKTLVESHGGRVSAASDGPGKGSTFTVELPFEPASQGEGAPPQAKGRRASDELPSLGRFNVLLVEDDEDTRAFLRRVLERSGARVQAMASVDEAIAVLENNEIDLLVSDLAMPHRDGYDLIRYVREREREVNGRLPAVAVTASGTAGDRDRAIAAGFDHYIRKPVDPAALIEAVRKIADQRRGERRQSA